MYTELIELHAMILDGDLTRAAKRCDALVTRCRVPAHWNYTDMEGVAGEILSDLTASPRDEWLARGVLRLVDEVRALERRVADLDP